MTVSLVEESWEDGMVGWSDSINEKLGGQKLQAI